MELGIVNVCETNIYLVDEPALPLEAAVQCKLCQRDRGGDKMDEPFSFFPFFACGGAASVGATREDGVGSSSNIETV